MEDLLPIDARSIPPTFERVADLTKQTTEARFIGFPKDLVDTAPACRLDRLWLQNMKPEAAARMAIRFDPAQLSLTNIQTADLGWLSQLARLRELLIEWNTKLESFGFLREVRPLIRLRADGLKRVNQLDDLESQPELKWLWIGGGIDRRLELESLRPLSSLTELEKLFLVSIKLKDESLAPLASLQRLEQLRLQSNVAPMEEYAHLAGALPRVMDGVLRGFMTLRWNVPPQTDLLDVIDEIDGAEQVIMVGKGGRRFSVAKDRDKIIAQLRRFREIRDSVPR